MKRIAFTSVLLALSLCLCACGAQGTDLTTGSVVPAPLAAAPETTPETVPETQPEADPDECPHPASEPERESNIIPHEPAGYCGNTMTSIRRYGEDDGVSFDGSDSVALTDLLRYLDYSEGVCRCMPEYVVDTEFGSGYGVNLTEGYVRHDGAQVMLTEEQTELVRGIIEAQIN